jgi:hypothetical protein
MHGFKAALIHQDDSAGTGPTLADCCLVPAYTRASFFSNVRIALLVAATGDGMRRPVYDRRFMGSFNQFNALEVPEKETGLEEEYHRLSAAQAAPNRIH